MAKTALQRLLAKTEAATLIWNTCQSQDAPVCICDSSGLVLLGDPTTVRDGHTIPLTEENRVIATVRGRSGCEAVAALLQHLINTESERLTLGRETLEKYRELAMLHDLGAKIGSCLNTKEVVRIVTEEIRSMMTADVVAILLCNEVGDVTEVFADHGDTAEHLAMPFTPEELSNNFLVTPVPEIVNDLMEDDRFSGVQGLRTGMCTPLTIRENTVGYVSVGSRKKTEYLAKDLKLLATLSEQAAMAFEKSLLYNQLQESFYAMVRTLAETIEKRDPYTSDHARRVVDYSLAIAWRLKLPGELHTRLEMAAALHDIGKLGVRDDVLLKKGPLNSEELAHMKMHTTFGEEILTHIKPLKDVIPGVRSHHERCDGSGYPHGLKGDKIDITARIIAVADAFDAMTSDRPYRTALSLNAAFSELSKHSGTQFDPAVVEAFLSAPVQEKLGIGMYERV